MDKKAQVVMVTLWVMAIFAVLALSIGRQVSLGLRLSQYQVDKMKSLYLARAGIAVAIREVETDANDVDSLAEAWADNEKKFKEIRPSTDSGGFAEVGLIPQAGGAVTVWGITDEERRVNINTAAPGLLSEILAQAGVQEHADTATAVCAWRGDQSLPAPEYKMLGYMNKGAAFTNPEELTLVMGLDAGAYEAVAGAVTTWGSGRINLNTASESVLAALIAYCKGRVGSQDNDPGNLTERIARIRPAASFGDLVSKLKEEGELSSGQTNVLNELQVVSDLKSTCFRIVSRGRLDQSPVSSTIECVFCREDDTMPYWHES